MPDFPSGLWALRGLPSLKTKPSSTETFHMGAKWMFMELAWILTLSLPFCAYRQTYSELYKYQENSFCTL